MLLSLLLSLTTLIAGQEGNAVVELPPDRTINLGLIDTDSVHTGAITLRNSGTAPLSLINVTTDCSCAVAGFPKQAIAPGDSASITVKFDGRDYPPGEFVKMVRIRSNATNRLVKVFVRGKIQRPKKK